jgi:hypothetical protein
LAKLENLLDTPVEEGGLGESSAAIQRVAGIGSRKGRINKVAEDITNELRTKLASAKLAAGGAGPGMQGSFRNADAVVSKMAPQQSGPVNIFNANQPGMKKSQMMQLLGGQGGQQPPPQQAPIAAPASVQNVNAALSRGQNPSTQQQPGRSRFNRGR